MFAGRHHGISFRAREFFSDVPRRRSSIERQVLLQLWLLLRETSNFHSYQLMQPLQLTGARATMNPDIPQLMIEDRDEVGIE
jgi:hypothetical protein